MLFSMLTETPSWEALGGSRLVQAAIDAGATALLLELRQSCQEGAFESSGTYSSAVETTAVLRSIADYRQYDRLADLVSLGTWHEWPCQALGDTACRHWL